MRPKTFPVKKCKDCGKPLSKPKMNKSGYCYSCYVKNKYQNAKKTTTNRR